MPNKEIVECFEFTRGLQRIKIESKKTGLAPILEFVCLLSTIFRLWLPEHLNIINIIGCFCAIFVI